MNDLRSKMATAAANSIKLEWFKSQLAGKEAEYDTAEEEKAALTAIVDDLRSKA